MLSLLSHDVFTIEEWLLILDHLEVKCPAFFRMIGRIEEDLASGGKSIKDDIIFEVDMENVVHGKANLFAICTIFQTNQEQLS